VHHHRVTRPLGRLDLEQVPPLHARERYLRLRAGVTPASHPGGLPPPGLP
jgi:hypothetical protein